MTTLPPASRDALRGARPLPRVSPYDRSLVSPGVVHFGVGCFHRAHQAVYFDDLARSGASTEWGLVGVGMHSRRIGEVLQAQDHRYTVVAQGPAGDDVRVVEVLGRHLFAPDDPAAVLAALTDQRTRLVTLTITAGAYPAAVDPASPDVVADVTRPHRPGTVFGYLVEALDRRRRAGTEPFTVLSCDNIPSNGAAARRAVVETARLRNPELAEWIEQRVAFPSSMVDRITPETSPQQRRAVARQHGLGDRWPVVTEPYSQWIIEDRFCNGRPPLERVGVQFVDDVRPYEVMKSRMVNGAHRALGYLGSLAGFDLTHEAMADPAVRGFVAGYLEEVLPTLPPVPGIDLPGYSATVLERLSNPRMGDPLARLCRQGSAKMPGYVLASLQEALDAGRPHGHLVLTVAAWVRHLQGTDHAGAPLPVEDVRAGHLQPLALAAATDPGPLLAESAIFGRLGEHPSIPGDLREALHSLDAGPLTAAASLALPGPRSPRR